MTGFPMTSLSDVGLLADGISDDVIKVMRHRRLDDVLVTYRA